MSRKAMQMALEALELFSEITDFTPAIAVHAIAALRAALDEPQTTHWEGCEEVHPECRKSEQEPVACIGTNGELMWLNKPKVIYNKAQPLYTAPPQRKPLSDEKMRLCFTSTNRAEPLAEGWPGLERFARAIERAHGIGGNDE